MVVCPAGGMGESKGWHGGMLTASLGFSGAVAAKEGGADAHAERGPPVLPHTRV